MSELIKVIEREEFKIVQYGQNLINIIIIIINNKHQSIINIVIINNKYL
jgi:hypothetical protein